MTAQASVCEILKGDNPFASASACDPRDFRYPDVPDVDRDVFESLIGIISKKARDPHMTCAVSVVGEAGSGKTQLIGRLAQYGANNKPYFNFAYIYPFVDPNQGYRYLLKELFINLKDKPVNGGQRTQIELICCALFAGVFILAAESTSNKKMLSKVDQIRKSPFLVWNTVQNLPPERKKIWFGHTQKTLMKKHPQLEPSFIKVLLQYLFHPEKRLAAEQWLMGYIIESDMAGQLGVRDRSRLSPEALEEEARKLILSLDEMLQYYGDRPIVVFFDQLEALRGDKTLEKFQDMVHLLTDKTRRIMPAAFFRGSEWEKKFKKGLDDFLYKRLRGTEYRLQGCTRPQALELIALRLQMALGDLERPDQLYPFLPDHQQELNRMLRAKYILPRQVVVRANKLLNDICNIRTTKPDSNRVIQEALKARFEEILANPDKYEPDEGRLILALELYIKTRSAKARYSATKLQRTTEKTKYLDLQGIISPSQGSAYTMAILIDVERHHASVSAGLKRGLVFLTQKGGRRALFVRDVRAPFPEPPRWPGTNAKLDEFKKAGGAVLFLDDKDAAMWYALALLSFAIESGDVIGKDGAPLTREHLDAFLAEGEWDRISSAFKGIDEYLSPKETAGKDAGDLASESLEILKNTPARLMRVELLLIKLQDRLKKNVQLEILMSELKKHDDRFSIIPAKDGLVLKLKLDWLHANDQA